MITKLQNSSNFPGNTKPTIVIDINDENWKEAYANWLSGKNPTDSIEWKKGVFALYF